MIGEPGIVLDQQTALLDAYTVESEHYPMIFVNEHATTFKKSQVMYVYRTDLKDKIGCRMELFLADDPDRPVTKFRVIMADDEPIRHVLMLEFFDEEAKTPYASMYDDVDDVVDATNPSKKPKTGDNREPAVRRMETMYNWIGSNLFNWTDLYLYADVIYVVPFAGFGNGCKYAPDADLVLLCDEHFKKQPEKEETFRHKQRQLAEDETLYPWKYRSVSQLVHEARIHGQKNLKNGQLPRIDLYNPAPAVPKNALEDVVDYVLRSLLVIASLIYGDKMFVGSVALWIDTAKKVDPNKMPCIYSSDAEHQKEVVARFLDAMCDISLYISNGLWKLGVDKSLYEHYHVACRANHRIANPHPEKVYPPVLSRLVKDFTEGSMGEAVPVAPLLVSNSKFHATVEFVCVQVISELAEALSAFEADQHSYLKAKLAKCSVYAQPANTHVLKTPITSSDEIRNYGSYRLGLEWAIVQELIEISITTDAACCRCGLYKSHAELAIALRNTEKRFPDGTYHRNDRGKVETPPGFKAVDMKQYLQKFYYDEPERRMKAAVYMSLKIRHSIETFGDGLGNESLVPAYYIHKLASRNHSVKTDNDNSNAN